MSRWGRKKTREWKGERVKKNIIALAVKIKEMWSERHRKSFQSWLRAARAELFWEQWRLIRQALCDKEEGQEVMELNTIYAE